MKTEASDHPQYGRQYHIGGLPLPSVTTVLDATRSAGDVEALRQWAERVGEEQAELIRKQSAER
ncbi:MAG: exonuclease, partial [Gemmatimonadaceae bacterium]|nr:exonuclease [Gloeobacterales cyanobacterium ES-bin-141]